MTINEATLSVIKFAVGNADFTDLIDEDVELEQKIKDIFISQEIVFSYSGLDVLDHFEDDDWEEAEEIINQEIKSRNEYEDYRAEVNKEERMTQGE